MKSDIVKYRAIDLYSGCGGMTKGLKTAGFNVIGAVEIDTLSVETYKRNHREVKIWQQDIRELAPFSMMKSLKLKPGDLDLLAACPPCQGFSSIRTLNGSRSIRDPRNNLVLQIARFVWRLRPKTIMLENVPGLRREVSFRFLKFFLRALGYSIVEDIVDAQDYGVPQRRKRLLMLAGKFGEIPIADKQKNRVYVSRAFKGLRSPKRSKDRLHNFPERRSEKVLKLIRKIPKNGGSRTDLSKKEQLECHQKTDGFKDVYGRMKWGAVAPTITGGCFNPSKGRFLHPTQNRAITLREAAILQSFPRSYYFSLKGGKVSAAEMIGNALPPKLVRPQAKAIIKALKEFRGGTDESRN